MKRKYEICKMQILVIAATELEIKPFIETASATDVLITGVGVPAVLYHLQKRMQQIDYDLIIQAGIAGTFNNVAKPGEVVFVKQDTFGDIGMEEKENFVSIFESGLADKNEFPFNAGWLMNTQGIKMQLNMQAVKAITVNKVSDSELQKQQFINQFNADIESMEGAALHYVCLQENMPFIQLRSISNIVGERNRDKWIMKEAIENLNIQLQQLIKNLNG
ncbi:MAG: futalosine hydrolase [Bacteroidetes bacterium]|nr:futalosine hydrolase [Bacteroidota bacterium]